MMTIVLSCPRLKSFVMIYGGAETQAANPWLLAEEQLAQDDLMVPDDDDDDDDGVVSSALASADMHHLVPFSGLTKLTIGEMEDRKSRLRHDWKDDILRILLASPDLKELTVSFSMRFTLSLWNGPGVAVNSFLHDLCDEYQINGGKPLKLSVLRLGLGVLVEPGDTPNEDREAPWPLKAPYLSKLTDLEQLQELYMDNRGRLDSNGYFWPDIGLYRNNKVAWDTFSQDKVPNLGQMTIVDQLELENLGEFLVPLVTIPVTTRIQNTEIRKRSGLDQVILKLWDSRVYPSPDPAAGIFSILAEDILAEDAVDESGTPPPDGQDPVWSAFFGLAANSSRLMVYTRCAGRGEGIYKMEQLEEGLRALPNLRELILGCPMNFDGFFKVATSQLIGPEAEYMEKRDLATTFGRRRWRKDVAYRLAQAGKGLRMIKFGRMAWRVLRGGGEDGSGVTRLLNMDRYEQRRRGCDRGPCNPYPEFAASLIGASFEYGDGVGAEHDARMW